MKISFLILGAMTALISTAEAKKDCGKIHSCCEALRDAGLRILRPGTKMYSTRDTSYFSVSAQLHPYCIVQPRNATEVSLAMITLQGTKCDWAVRGGGHMTWAGASNINDGVTIDMGLMKDISYDKKTKTAQVAAGSLWSDAYRALEEYGVTVPGGRTSSVGVIGFLLGGGNNFFSSKTGLGCDNVVEWQVVLGDGKVILANKNTNADLWKALKGGSGNFGIVTRVTIMTVPVVSLWGGQVVYPQSTTDEHITAYVDWVDHIRDYPDGSAVTFWAYTPGAGTSVAVAMHDTSNEEWASAYDPFKAIDPKMQDTLRHDSHLNFTIELEEPLNYRQIWITITGKNDERFIRRAVDAQASFIRHWQDTQDGDFYNYITFQAMPTILFEHSNEKGGNVLGMNQEKDDAILYQMQHMVKTEDQEKQAREQLTVMRQDLIKYYKQESIDVEWQYFGYADGTQDPLGSYGADNIKFMKDVAAKYDPRGVFQTRVPGGFKLSAVN